MKNGKTIVFELNRWIHGSSFLFLCYVDSVVCGSGRGEEPSGGNVLRLIQIRLATSSLGKIWPVYQSNSAQRQIATILWAHEGAFSAAAQTQPPRGGIITSFAPVVEKVAPSVVTVFTNQTVSRALAPFSDDIL